VSTQFTGNLSGAGGGSNGSEGKCEWKMTTNSFSREALQKPAERFAQGEHVPHVGGGKIWPHSFYSGSLAADLEDANYLSISQDRSADDFLNGLNGFSVYPHSFEYAGVARFRKIIVEFGPAVASGACGKRGSARERDVSDIAKRLRRQKIQMAPLCGETEYGHFVRSDADDLRNAFRDRSQRNIRSWGSVRFQFAGKMFEFRNQVQVCTHQISLRLRRTARREGQKRLPAGYSTLYKMKLPCRQERIFILFHIR